MAVVASTRTIRSGRPPRGAITDAEVTTRRSVDWATVVVAWAVSRVVVLVSVAVSSSSLRDGLASWDTSYYLGIARSGYGAPPLDGIQTNWPFFPFLPALIRTLSAVGLPPRGSVLVLNTLIFVVGLAGVSRLARAHFDDRSARLAVWALALFPLGVVFSMGYPSAIFLAASTWAFAWADDDAGPTSDVCAGLAVVAATLVRPNGLVVALALGAWLLLARRQVGRAAVVALPGAVVFGAWCFMQWRWTGDPFAFWAAKSAWEEITLVELLADPRLGAVSHVVLAAVAVGVLVLGARRIPSHWLVFAALYLGPPLILGVTGLGRYSNECFPVFVAGGAVLASVPKPVRWLALVAGACGLVAFSVMVTRYEFVP